MHSGDVCESSNPCCQHKIRHEMCPLPLGLTAWLHRCLNCRCDLNCVWHRQQTMLIAKVEELGTEEAPFRSHPSRAPPEGVRTCYSPVIAPAAGAGNKCPHQRLRSGTTKHCVTASSFLSRIPSNGGTGCSREGTDLQCWVPCLSQPSRPPAAALINLASAGAPKARLLQTAGSRYRDWRRPCSLGRFPRPMLLPPRPRGQARHSSGGR